MFRATAVRIERNGRQYRASRYENPPRFLIPHSTSSESCEYGISAKQVTKNNRGACYGVGNGRRPFMHARGCCPIVELWHDEVLIAGRASLLAGQAAEDRERVGSLSRRASKNV